MAQKLKTDFILFTTIVVMVFFGLVMLYSASSVMAQLKFGSSWHFFGRQLAWMAVAIIGMMLLKRTHYRTLQTPAVAFAAMGVALILLLVVYFADGDHHRWLRLGPLGLQPSELAKPAMVIFLAFFVTLRARAINTRYTLLPAAMAVGLVGVGVAVADLGTAVVLMATVAVVFFVAGLELRYCWIALAVAACGIVFFVASKPYRLARIVHYIDPSYKLVDRIDSQGRLKTYLNKSLTSRDTSYQAEQSKIAVGAGGTVGLGLMQGKQKLLYLPEAHTDFIYAVVSEELGLIGAVFVLAGFLVILWRGLRATVRMPDDFGRYLALGITTMLVVQAFMNISVVLGMMPTKGIPLPLISSGGSSLVSTLASLGILMNVSEHAG
ncbi:MAG TPA: putative peptidoglycan glycosyltransferase FtsW [Bryobacteraceae bacterium]|jgi:cell division protein FtsW|nr:putative peptidoglycan glycosyltransferase FtsW [Bryobacteraceae bacterium]